MEEATTYVGIDVHKRTIAVSNRFPDGGRDERTIPHEARAVNRFVRKMKREAPGEILCAYEAGPCGYGLYPAPARGRWAHLPPEDGATGLRDTALNVCVLSG